MLEQLIQGCDGKMRATDARIEAHKPQVRALVIESNAGDFLIMLDGAFPIQTLHIEIGHAVQDTHIPLFSGRPARRQA